MPRNVGVRGNTPVVSAFPSSPVRGDQATLAADGVTYQYSGTAWTQTVVSDLSGASVSPNFLTDSSFELGTNAIGGYNTTRTLDTTTSRSGVRSLKAVLTDTFGAIDVGVEPVTVGKTYTTSGYVKVNAGTNVSVAAQLRFYTSNYDLLDDTTGLVYVTAGTSWTRISHTRTAPAGAALIVMLVNLSGPNGSVTFIDDLQFEEGSSATGYQPKTGEVTSSVSGKLMKFADGSGRVLTDSGYPAALATTSTPGFMAAADKTKLDGLGGSALASPAPLTATPATFGATETPVYRVPVAANLFQVGTTIKITAHGIISATNPTLLARLRLGAAGTTADAQLCATAAAAVTNGTGWTAEFYATIRTTGASGTALGNGILHATAPAKTTQTASVAVNTTAANFLCFTLVGGGTSPVVTVTNAFADIVKL